MQVLQELGIDPQQAEQKAAAKMAAMQNKSSQLAAKKANMRKMVLDLVGSK